jgi:DNA recombination-dependent growth factor C
MEQVRNGLIQHAIPKMENEYEEISAGWTPLESPYLPDFEKFSFVFGSYFLFSLRIDKKSIPAKLVHKQMAIEIEKKKADSGRDFISKNEKSEIKETIMDVLMHKMPSIPNVYDVLWDYDAKTLFLLTTQKAANEFFETIFFKSFKKKEEVPRNSQIGKLSSISHRPSSNHYFLCLTGGAKASEEHTVSAHVIRRRATGSRVQSTHCSEA